MKDRLHFRFLFISYHSLSQLSHQSLPYASIFHRYSIIIITFQFVFHLMAHQRCSGLSALVTVFSMTQATEHLIVQAVRRQVT